MGLYYDIALIFSFENIYPEKMIISAFVEIISTQEENENNNKYEIKILKNEDLPKSKNTKLIMYIDKEVKLKPGDIIWINGNFEKAQTSRNYKGFNYRNYLKQKKIYGIVNIESYKYITRENDIYSFFGNIQISLTKKINELYDEQYAEFLKGILLGNTSGLDDKIQEDFKDSSISHILAISGMHVTYVVTGMNGVLNLISKNKKCNNYILILFLLFFSIITGGAVSCIRACIMNGIVLISSNLYRKNNFYTEVLFSLFIIIFINPFNIFNIGMWLSYMGTVGIVIFNKFIYKFCKKRLKIMDYILQNFSVSMSAQILIFPIMIYVFNNFSISFFIPNILVSFFIGFVLILGYVSILLAYILFPISKLISYIEKFLIFLILKIAEICGQIPFSKIYMITPNFITIIIYYLIIIFIIIYFNKNKFKVLKVILNPRKIINIIFKLRKWIIIFFICILIFQRIFFINFKLEIHFLDVGQGDCTYIKTPLGKNILIDGGEGNSEKYDYGKNVVFPYLLDRKVNKIDYLIISHCDSDHIGGTFEVIKNMNVDKILIGLQLEKSEQLNDLINIANHKNIEIIVLQAGDIFKIENNLELQILWPKIDELIEDNALNNNSLLFKLKYKDFSILFTGDIEKLVENKIIEIYQNNELESDILKVAHHGSKTSTISKFLGKVNPKIALIGAGVNNKFGHPNDEVINRLENCGVSIYRTDKNGEISIVVNGEGKIKVNEFCIEKGY